MDRPRGPRPDRQTDTTAEAFLQKLHHPTTSNDDDITQDFEAMLKRGKDKHNAKAKAAKALHEKPYTRSNKFMESLPDGSTKSSIKIHHLHGFKKHARDHMADHRVIPPLYAEQDRVERVTAECMSNGQKRYIVQWADTYMLCHHIPLHAKTGYKPAETSRCPEFGRRFGPAAGKRVAKVRWQEK